MAAPLPVICLAGPTGCGKTAAALALAEALGGEVINADSRQVYSDFPLITAQPSPEEQACCPHHLYGFLPTEQKISAGRWADQAVAEAKAVLARGHVPLLVGGTGLYVDSVADGYELSNRMPDLAYRAELEKRTTEELYAMLVKAVPDVEVERRNRNRVMRLLEKLHDGDDIVPGRNPRYETLRLGVTWDRDTLRRRIDERLDRRLNEGMVEEVRGLLDRGVSEEFLLKLGLEYRFITQYLTGRIATLEEMRDLLSTAIKQFAKRQMTWFRRDQAIHWLDMTADPAAQACALIDGFLTGKNAGETTV